MQIFYDILGLGCFAFSLGLTFFSLYCTYYIVFSTTQYYGNLWKWLVRFLFFPIVLVFIFYFARLPIFFSFGAGVALFLAGVH